jgi:adenine-specific DNA-methyltransferase
MHGVRLHDPDEELRSALPLLALNSVTMLGGEVFGRAYGGGVLKMEPREAAKLPVPTGAPVEEGWKPPRDQKRDLDAAVRAGDWPQVVEVGDEVLLHRVAGLSREAVNQLSEAAALLRRARLGVRGRA